jgi:hypothetical protein
MGLFEPKQTTTQQHLDIEDIRDNLVLLKGGKVSLVIETTSLNFELLADREQDVRIFTFAGLLNSLHFPIQIVIRTQQKDISKYKEVVEAYKQKAGSASVKEQITIYEEFITNLTTNSVILDKRFYAIIPSIMSTSVATGGLREIFGKSSTVYNADQTIAKAMLELNPKRDHLIKQFANMGLAARQMTNDELIRLYYSIYEPDKAGLEVLNIREDGIGGALITTDVPVDEPPDIAAAANNPFQGSEFRQAQGQITQVSSSGPTPAAPST